MHRILLLLALVAVTLLSGCATMEGVFGSPAPSRPAYRSGNQATVNTSGPVGQRQYAPKTEPYTVFGKRYYPLQSAAGYNTVGIASWYGRDFHGKPTASGDIYDMHELTAAHKTLPLGTVVQVTNLNNGRRVDLLVNDRGPFVGERVIDLSYAAARALGSADQGLAKVRIQAVGMATAQGVVPFRGSAPVRMASAPQPQRSTPQRTAAAAPARTAPRTTVNNPTTVAANGFAVQVGAFRERGNADRVMRHLQSKGFQTVHVATVNGSNGSIHLVRVGNWQSKDSAAQALQMVKVYYPSSFITS
ncbi:MAG: septal ring lytic transglycosylase RlpA family protein [Desulfovibrionaceae bacterium]